MKPTSFRRTLLGAVLTVGLITAGCSSSYSNSTAKADAGKKDTGAGGGSAGSSARGGSGGSGGSSASGGAGGSGGGSGGSSASGGSGGSAGAGGTSASGGSAGSGGSTGSGGSSNGAAGGGGTGGGTGGTSTTGTGGAQANDGGGVDAETSDALDAPAPSEDGPSLQEAGSSEDVGVTVSLDSGSLDSEGMDTVAISLDAAVDTSVEDAAADLPEDSAVDTGNPSNCVQQIIDNGYAFSGAPACSVCQANSSDTLSAGRCTAMIDCVETNWPACSSGSCHLDCLHNVSGDNVVDICVTDLVHASCGPNF